MAATRTPTARIERGPPRVYVAVLNWNGWGDTLTCLESVLRSDYPNFRVLVCDNDSSDGSFDRLRDWAAGRLDAVPAPYPVPAGLATPPVAKPVPCLELSHARALGPADGLPDVPLTLIRTGANRGFAGGNNVALRHALARGDAGYVWILNNDTVVEPDCLSRLVARLRSIPDAGLCGATLRDFESPHRVQAMGGARFNPWLGTHRVIGAGRDGVDEVDAANAERDMSYVIGASMLASRRWLEEVGLLCEDYFLYFEEIDWAMRGRERLRLAYAPHATVYHRQGASAGRPGLAARADYLALRNRLRFTRNRVPWALPTVWLGFAGVLLNRLRRGQLDRLKPILGIMFGREHPV